MPTTIEHQIFDLLCERLRQHMAGPTPENVIVAVPIDGSVSNISRITVSGAFTGSYPRSFEVKKTDAGECHISEVTLFAELGISSPAPYDDDVSFTDGVPFEIANTGIFISIDSLANVDSEWMIRMGNSYTKIPSIHEHPIDYQSLGAPCLCVYATGNTVDKLVLEKAECKMDVTILISIGKEQVENGDHLEILGDIRNCINRDPKLWDGTKCLSEDISYMSDTFYEQTDRGNSIFICEVQITYRTSIKNARIK